MTLGVCLCEPEIDLGSSIAVVVVSNQHQCMCISGGELPTDPCLVPLASYTKLTLGQIVLATKLGQRMFVK